MKIKLAIILFFLHAAIGHAKSKLQIALSFDDAPRQDTSYFKGIERTNKLIEVLQKKNIKQVAFYCTTFDFPQESIDRLKKYDLAGHIIANHTAHHLDYNRTKFDQFLADIEEAEQRLSQFSTFKKWFRFPFLRDSSKNNINAVLTKKGYKNGYITVETYDWKIDLLFQADIAEKKNVDLQKLREAYLKIMWESIEFYDHLAKKTLNRSPKHVILLHENDINALFIGDLIDLIRSKGGKIITAEEAYQDSIANSQYDSLPFSQTRLRALARKNSYKGPLMSKWENGNTISSFYKKTIHKK